MTHLITFADKSMSIAANICAESSLSNGIDSFTIYRPQDIDPDFMWQNKDVLMQKRGAGYWLWKPYFILRALNELKDGNYLVYSDAGIEFVNSIKNITDRMTGDIWLFGNQYQHVHWCKGDAIMPNLEFYNDKYHFQVQASVIIIRNTKNARTFVDSWLHHCCKPGLIDDSQSMTPNHPDFKEHRHDQAILTSLAYINLLTFHWWPAMYNCGAFSYDHSGYTDTYPVLFHHHRCRNNEITLPGIFREYFHKKYPGII